MPNNDQLSISFDGSHTVVNDRFSVPYHSKHGAIAESNVVFIGAGLNYLKDLGKKEIHIFEMGFGTGLNSLLTYQWAKSHEISIFFHTVEAYPLPLDTIAQLNYTKILGDQVFFDEIHSVDWNVEHHLRDSFVFCKHLVEIENLALQPMFDVVFYDAFAPSSQPHLWEPPIMQKMYDCLTPNGALVSYCAQGAFKRHLKSVGFTVEGLPGPPGKREMTRGIKI